MAKTVIMRGRKLRIVRRRTATAFVPVYEAFEQVIRRTSYSSRTPGMDRDDIAAEMAYCLWVAYRRFDSTMGDFEPGGAFHSFWWSIWLNHRVSWIRRYNADKRAAAELPFTHDELMAMSPVVYPGQLLAPPDIEDDEIAHCAWSLLALGYLPTEVRDALHLNNHKYYAMIDSWKTATVHDWLTGQYH